MSSIGVLSLGCAKNQVDTERMLGLLLASGHTLTNDPAKAEVLIVNTCGFIEPAKQESINAILEMAQYKKSGRCRVLVATGCLTERYRKELTEALPEADLLLGIHDYAALPGLLAAALAGEPADGRAEMSTASSAPLPLCAGTPRVLTTPPYRAYLRVGDGCNNRCAYCAIPLIRGPLSSEPMDALLFEAAQLAENGVTELTVIAQDTSGYGLDLYGKPMLPTLIARLSEIDALHWIRVLYTYPDTVDEALIDAFRDNPKVANYLDLPLQHISDAVLTRMNRRGTHAHIERVLRYIEANAPDFTLRTTMMVGFPGETDADFSQLLAFLRDHPFDRVGCFSFSPEEGTAAADMPDQVPEAVKAERLNALMTQQQSISAARNARRVGRTVELLVEGQTEDGGVFGRSLAEAPDADGKILVSSAPGAKPGDYLSILLTEAGAYDMKGVIHP